MSLSQSSTTHCPYCALQCGMRAIVGEHGLDITGNTKFPVNEGGLCIKGQNRIGVPARSKVSRT
jgi:assimilatory nitrate reductase catalytic subunit